MPLNTGLFLIISQTSKPKICGSPTSITATAGLNFFNIKRASLPVEDSITSKPEPSSTSLMISLVAEPSTATSTFFSSGRRASSVSTEGGTDRTSSFIVRSTSILALILNEEWQCSQTFSIVSFGPISTILKLFLHPGQVRIIYPS